MKETFLMGRFDRNLADTRRWGIVRTLREQNVATHSYYVALMMKPLMEHYGYCNPARVRDAMYYALIHDRDEVLTGDLPTPLKSRMPKNALDEVTREFGLKAECDDPVIKLATKVLDTTEALMFLAEEEGMGNKRVADVMWVIKKKLMKVCKEFEKDAPLKHDVPLYDVISGMIYSMAHDRVDPLEPSS